MTRAGDVAHVRHGAIASTSRHAYTPRVDVGFLASVSDAREGEYEDYTASVESCAVTHSTASGSVVVGTVDSGALGARSDRIQVSSAGDGPLKTWCWSRSGRARERGARVATATTTTLAVYHVADDGALDVRSRVNVAFDDEDVKLGAVVALAWTRDGKGLTCARADGSVATYGDARRDVWDIVWRTRLAPLRANEDVPYDSIHISVGDDTKSSIAMTIGGIFAYVAHADGAVDIDELRHPALVMSTSWRHRSLVTLCCDGALRLWLHSLGNHGPMALTRTIQTPLGGLTPIVAFDWLDVDDTSDSLYDHALIGLDGSSRIHVWTMTDIESLHPLTTRRPDVTHRGSTTLEHSISPTFEDAPTVRASLRGTTDDMRVLLASHRFGVIIARTKAHNSDVLECLCSVQLGGHETAIVDMRRHPTEDVLVTLDASGACKIWKRNTRGAIDLLDDISEHIPINCSAIAWGQGVDGRKPPLLSTLLDGVEIASTYVDPETGAWVEVKDEFAVRDRAVHAQRVEMQDALRDAIASVHATNSAASVVELSDDQTRVAFFDAQGALNIATIIDAKKVELSSECVEKTCFVENARWQPKVRWFDLGAGDCALAVAVGTRLEVYAASPYHHMSTGKSWTCVMAIDVSDYAEDVDGGFISSIEWSYLGDVIFATIGTSILTISGDETHQNVAQLAMTATVKLPSYHPDVLYDWLMRGQISRARMSVRSVIEYLRKGDFTEPYASLLPGQLLAASEHAANSPDVTSVPKVVEVAPPPSMVPEFDMSAFGSFGGGMPAAAPAVTFSFGADLEPTSTLMSSPTPKSMSALKTHDRFTRSENEEATELLSTQGKHLRLTSTECMRFLGVLDALRGIDDGTSTSVDEAGRRFLALWNTRRLKRHAEGHELGITSGQELCWANQCANTEALLEAVIGDQMNADVSWSMLKRLGIPIWLRRDEELRNLVERCAKAEFARTKNVDDCAILFVITGRVKVLAGLYKATQNTRLYEFMCRDFSDPRHREAALKNAYALLSKHRYTFAAVFFVLAGQALDAASLVWKHERDLPLALVIERLANTSKDMLASPMHLSKCAVNMLECDVIPSTSDPWMLAALYSLAGNHRQFLEQAKALIDSGNPEAADLLTFISHENKSEIAEQAKVMATNASGTLAVSFESNGMPLAALERLVDHARGIDVVTKCRLAVGAILSEELFREIPEAEYQAFTRTPWNLNLAMMQTLLQQRSEIFHAKGFESIQTTPHETKTPTSNKVHGKSPSLLPSEVLTVKIPRVPSGQDLKSSSSPSEKINLARNAFSKLRTIRVKTTLKRQKNTDSMDGPDSPTTPRTPDYYSESTPRVESTAADRCLRSPVTVAALQNDGFYDLCFNHEVPYELGCASVRQGLSIVNLRQLNSAAQESRKDAWAVLLRAQPPIAGFKSPTNSWLNADDAPSGPASPKNAHVREHEWATHAGLDMTTLTGIIPYSENDTVGRSRKVIKREPANDVVARSVAAHPSRSFFAVGTSMGGVQLWNFHGENADNAAAVLSLGGKKATSGTGASTRALAWSPHGARLAACASDGNVTLWLGDAPDVEPAASKMCGFKGCKTEDVRFLSTNVMAVATSSGSSASGAKPECIALWDALQPITACPGILRAHAGGCTTLAQFPSLTAPHGVPWPFLITGGYHGDIAAHDLRMLGGDGDSTILWRSTDPHTKSVTSIATIHHEHNPLIIAGDNAGEIRVYSALDGTLRQSIPSAHAAQKFLTPRGGGAFASIGVSRILPIHDGVLSAGGDGLVKCFRLDRAMKTAF